VGSPQAAPDGADRRRARRGERAGELSYRELAYWSATRPHEVPLVGTGQGGPGEFEWIAMLEPDIAEHNPAASRARDERQLFAEAETRQRRAAGRRGGLAR
jgi:hypothetical protein